MGSPASGHSSNPDRIQEEFGQFSQAHGVTLRVSCTGTEFALNDPDGSLPLSRFYESIILHAMLSVTSLFLALVSTILGSILTQIQKKM